VCGDVSAGVAGDADRGDRRAAAGETRGGRVTKKPKVAVNQPRDEYPVSFETFKAPSFYALHAMKQDEPSCFNSVVNVRRYRITIERIEEPDEIIRERVQKLWDHGDNHHHWNALRAAGKHVGLDLDIKTFGSKRDDRR
jgi:hypothetical protein